MHKFQVGELYSPNVTSWPDGKTDYNWTTAGHELRVFMASPSSQEVYDYKKGRAEFAFSVFGNIITLQFRFGAQPWSDATYNYWLLDETLRPDKMETWPTEASRFPVLIILIDAATGIIKALRTVSFSPEFSAQLAIAVRHQIESGSPVDHDTEIRRYLTQYPDPKTLIPAALSRCTGGSE